MVIFTLLFSLSNASAVSTAKDVHEVSDICISVQRALKDYVLIGLNFTYDDPQDDLDKSIKRIDFEFSDLLKDHHLGATLESEVEAIKRQWIQIKNILIKSPEKELALELHHQGQEFNKDCWVVAEHIASDTKIEGEHYVVVANELLMEVERLAELYFLKAWQVDAGDYYQQAEGILLEFENFYTELMNSDEKLIDKETKELLARTEKNFVIFEKMVASKSGRFVPALAQRSTKRIKADIHLIIEKIISNVEGSKP